MENNKKEARDKAVVVAKDVAKVVGRGKAKVVAAKKDKAADKMNRLPLK